MLPMTTLDKKQLIEKVRALVAEHGRKWKKISDELNKARITTLKGQSWSKDNSERFYERHCVQAQQPGSKTPQPLSRELPEWMDSAAEDDLKSLLEWWRQKKGSPLGEIQARPVFKGRRRNSGFHVNDTILKRAMEKVKKDKVRTGGSLSLLVELLLWEYIGKPEDVLEPVQQESIAAL
jgi:hypothetical protein